MGRPRAGLPATANENRATADGPGRWNRRFAAFAVIGRNSGASRRADKRLDELGGVVLPIEEAEQIIEECGLIDEYAKRCRHHFEGSGLFHG